MRLAAIAITTLLITGTAAQAGCVQSQLAGGWRVGSTGTGSICNAYVSKTGSVWGNCGYGSVELSSSCKIEGWIGGRKLYGATDPKSNVFIGELGDDGIAAYRR